MRNRSENRSSLHSYSKASLPRNQRISLKMVPSTYEPPEDTQPTHALSEHRTEATLHPAVPYQEESSPFLNSSINHNLQFLKTFVSMNSITFFDQGDCIPLDSDDRWIVASGEVKVTGVNELHFSRKAGFIFFASGETKRKIKEVVAVRHTTAYRISQQIFKEHVRNFLFMKNAEKIKFMKYCPFLVWNQSLAEDLAISIDLLDKVEKDAEIYKNGEEADYLYFVKEGIVLLERLGKAGNDVIRDYEKHYESTYLSEEEGLLIVRKGMIFGVDGILIKEKANQVNLIQNPQAAEQSFQPYEETKVGLKTTRIYTAKAIGKVEIYRLEKSVLETYLKMSEYLKEHPEEKSMSRKELDRICVEYTNLLMGGNVISKSVRKKNLDLEIRVAEELAAEMQKKREKVKEIKENHKKMKKVPKKEPEVKHEHEESVLFNRQSPKLPKIESSKSMRDISLPSLNRKHMELLIMKQVEMKESKKYLEYKKKVEKELMSREGEAQGQGDTLQCMKVKSYRSLLSPLN